MFILRPHQGGTDEQGDENQGSLSHTENIGSSNHLSNG